MLISLVRVIRILGLHNRGWPVWRSRRHRRGEEVLMVPEMLEALSWGQGACPCNVMAFIYNTQPGFLLKCHQVWSWEISIDAPILTHCLSTNLSKKASDSVWLATHPSNVSFINEWLHFRNKSSWQTVHMDNYSMTFVLVINSIKRSVFSQVNPSNQPSNPPTRTCVALALAFTLSISVINCMCERGLYMQYASQSAGKSDCHLSWCTLAQAWPNGCGKAAHHHPNDQKLAQKDDRTDCCC